MSVCKRLYLEHTISACDYLLPSLFLYQKINHTSPHTPSYFRGVSETLKSHHI